MLSPPPRTAGRRAGRGAGQSLGFAPSTRIGSSVNLTVPGLSLPKFSRDLLLRWSMHSPAVSRVTVLYRPAIHDLINTWVRHCSPPSNLRVPAPRYPARPETRVGNHPRNTPDNDRRYMLPRGQRTGRKLP